MFKNLSEKFLTISSKKLTILAAILFLAFTMLFLPGQNAIAETYSAGAGSPDTFLFYTPTDLYQMAETYGSEGRTAYIHARWTFDLSFPIIYTFFLIVSISWFEKQVLKEDSELRTGNILPLLAMLFDLLENVSTSLVFSSYPDYLSFVSMLAPFFTLMKWICLGASFIFLFILVFWSFFKKSPQA